MTREEAYDTIKQELINTQCVMCPYDSSKDIDSCDIKSCDIRDSIKILKPEPDKKYAKMIRWYEQKEMNRCVEYIPRCKCSECGKEYDPYTSRFIKYCSGCGAKMEDF